MGGQQKSHQQAQSRVARETSGKPVLAAGALVLIVSLGGGGCGGGSGGGGGTGTAGLSALTCQDPAGGARALAGSALGNVLQVVDLENTTGQPVAYDGQSPVLEMALTLGAGASAGPVPLQVIRPQHLPAAGHHVDIPQVLVGTLAVVDSFAAAPGGSGQRGR
jgi:hypothetical protein